MPCWSCLLPLSRADIGSGDVICQGTHCRDFAGRPGTSVEPCAPSGRGGNRNHGAYLWPWRIPSGPGEFPHGSSLLCIVLLLLVVRKVVPCGAALTAALSARLLGSGGTERVLKGPACQEEPLSTGRRVAMTMCHSVWLWHIVIVFFWLARLAQSHSSKQGTT